jgi:hypothetical protein
VNAIRRWWRKLRDTFLEWVFARSFRVETKRRLSLPPRTYNYCRPSAEDRARWEARRKEAERSDELKALIDAMTDEELYGEKR